MACSSPAPVAKGDELRGQDTRRRGRSGVAGIEFAITAPLLLLLLLGTADLMLWMRTWLRFEQTASALAEMVTRYTTLYTSDFTGTFAPIAQAGVGAASLGCASGGMMVTGIDNSTGVPRIGWRWASGTCVVSAVVLGSAAAPALPGGYVPPAGLSAIVVELFTTQPSWVFSAGLMQSAGLSAISSYAVVMPRSGTLPPYTPGNRPS